MWYLDKKKNCWTNGSITLPVGSQPTVTKDTPSNPEKIKDIGAMWSSSSVNTNNGFNSSSSTGSDKKKADNKKQVSAMSSSGVGKARLW